MSLSGFTNVYAVIGALDERPVFNDRCQRAAKSLYYIFANAPDSLYLVLTSRKEPDIDVKLRVYLSKSFKFEIDLLAHHDILNPNIQHDI